MNSRMARLVAWNRSSTLGGTWAPGRICFGARQRRVLGDGSMTVRMNQRPNHPGAISATRPARRPASDPAIARRYTSFAIARCSRHWPTLHWAGLRLQLSSSGVRPCATALARRSAAASSESRRSTQAGAGPPMVSVTRDIIVEFPVSMSPLMEVHCHDRRPPATFRTVAAGQQPAKADSMRAQMEQTSAMMGPMMGQMMEAMMEGMLKVMEKPENAQRLATFTRNYYDAMIRKGFTKEQALQIVIASGMPRLPSGPR